MRFDFAVLLAYKKFTISRHSKLPKRVVFGIADGAYGSLSAPNVGIPGPARKGEAGQPPADKSRA